MKTIQSLEQNQGNYDIFSGEEANRRYPQLTLPAKYECVYDKDGGILLADKALAAFQVSAHRFAEWVYTFHCIPNDTRASL